MMNTRINYRWNDNEEINSIVTDGVYDFEDWLSDSLYTMYGSNYTFEQDGDTYYILDGCNERTGEYYTVISTEPTNEELRG